MANPENTSTIAGFIERKETGKKDQEKQDSLKIIFAVSPVAQGRSRSVYRGNRVINYDPPKSREFKETLKRIAKIHRPAELLEGPLCVTIKIYREIPKSFSKKKRREALSGELLPVTRPDLKNYIAGIEDALTGIIYQDDSQIIRYGKDTGKLYGDPPRIEIDIKEL